MRHSFEEVCEYGTKLLGSPTEAGLLLGAVIGRSNPVFESVKQHSAIVKTVIKEARGVGLRSRLRFARRPSWGSVETRTNARIAP